MQFGVMLERGTIDAVFILRLVKEDYDDYYAEGKIVCFLWTWRKLFDRVPWKVQGWVMWKK